jgi:hypothetical protein
MPVDGRLFRQPNADDRGKLLDCDMVVSVEAVL